MFSPTETLLGFVNEVIFAATFIVYPSISICELLSYAYWTTTFSPSSIPTFTISSGKSYLLSIGLIPFFTTLIIDCAHLTALSHVRYLLNPEEKKAMTASPTYLRTYPSWLSTTEDISCEKALTIVTTLSTGSVMLILVEPTRSAYIITSGILELTCLRRKSWPRFIEVSY